MYGLRLLLGLLVFMLAFFASLVRESARLSLVFMNDDRKQNGSTRRSAVLHVVVKIKEARAEAQRKHAERQRNKMASLCS